MTGLKNRIPNHPPWVVWLRYGAIAGWMVIFAIGLVTITPGTNDSPFMEHGLTIMALGLCVGGVGASVLFGGFGPDEEPEAMDVMMSKLVGLVFMGGGLLLEYLGLKRLF